MDELSEIEVLENELRHCLRHVPPPAGFTDRVMERVAVREAARRRRPAWAVTGPAKWWMAAAAALVLTVGGADALHLQHQRQEREAAAVQAQMDLALQLTSRALNGVQTGLDHSAAGRFAQLWNGTEE